MMGSKMIAGLALVVPLCFATVATAQVPVSPERPAKGGMAAAATPAIPAAAGSTAAEAVAAPRPTAKGPRAGTRSGAGLAAGHASISAPAVPSPAAPVGPARAALKGDSAPWGGRGPVGATSSLDGVIPTLQAPDPAAAPGRDRLADIIRAARGEAEALRSGDPARPGAPAQPRGKEKDGGAGR